MADGVIKAILPTTPVQGQSSSVTNPLSQLLQLGQSVNLQVLKVLSAHDVLFQGNGFQLKLHLEQGASFKPGSGWVFQSDQHSKNFLLKPDSGVVGERHIIVRHGTQLEELVPRQSTQTANVNGRQGGVASGTSNPSLLPTANTKNGIGNNTVSEKLLQQAIQFHRQDAATKQNSFAKIFSSLPEIASGRSSTINSLPEGEAIQKLAKQILSLRISPNVTGSSLKAAVQSSGIFHDAQEALLLSTSASSKGGGSETVGSNLKQELLILQNFLVRAGGRPHVASHIAKGLVPTLPERDGPIHGQKPVQYGSQEQASRGVLNSLIDQAVEGLARMKLLQLASLPQTEMDYNQSSDKARIQLNLELPVALSNEQTAIVALRITHDDQQGGNQEGRHGHSWSIDLAMDTEETGPVDAQIRFTSKGVRIILWAANKEFSQELQEGAERLTAGLNDEGLEIDSIKILNGLRPDPSRYFPQQSGRYLDSSM